MKGTRWLYVVLALGVLVWWWGPFGGGDEDEIRAQLERLEELVEKSPDEPALESADRARRVSELLTRDFVVRLGPTGQTLDDPAALARPFVGLRRGVERLGVGFSDIEIEIEVPGRQARSTQIATLTAAGGQWSRRAYDTAITWQVENGRWRMQHVEVGAER